MLGKLIFKFHTIKLMNTPALSPKGLFLFAEIHRHLLIIQKEFNEFSKQLQDLVLLNSITFILYIPDSIFDVQ